MICHELLWNGCDPLRDSHRYESKIHCAITTSILFRDRQTARMAVIARNPAITAQYYRRPQSVQNYTRTRDWSEYSDLTGNVFASEKREAPRPKHTGIRTTNVLVTLNRQSVDCGTTPRRHAVWWVCRLFNVYPRDLYNAATSRTLVNPAVIPIY